MWKSYSKIFQSCQRFIFLLEISLLWPVSNLIACGWSQTDKCDRRECLFFPRPRLEPSWFRSDTWSPMLRDSNAGGRWWDGYWSEWDSTEIQRRLDPRPIWCSPPCPYLGASCQPSTTYHPNYSTHPLYHLFMPLLWILFKSFLILVASCLIWIFWGRIKRLELNDNPQKETE